MNKIIILGNGFDLAHGLNTSYKDFIRHIIDLSVNYDEDVRKDLINVGTLFSEYKNYDFISNNFIEIIKFQNRYGKIEFGNSFFRTLLMKYFQTDWLDIEQHYFHVLSITKDRDINRLQSEFEIVKKYLELYLTKISTENNVQYIPEFNDIFLENDPNSIIFLNFNYTSTIEIYVDHLNQIKEIQIINIHGELNSDNNPIVFGYGDDSSPKYNELIRKNKNIYLRNLKRQQYNLADKYETLNRGLNQLLDRREETEICSIGHSLGLTDKTLLSEILEHPAVSRIKLFYYQDVEGFRNLNDNIRRIVNGQAFRKIVSYPNSSSIPQM